MILRGQAEARCGQVSGDRDDAVGDRQPVDRALADEAVDPGVRPGQELVEEVAAEEAGGAGEEDAARRAGRGCAGWVDGAETDFGWGTASARSRSTVGRSAGAPSSMAAANVATVGAVKSVRIGTVTPRRSRTAARMWAAMSECPPMAKKSVVRSTSDRSRTVAQMAATARSVVVRGGSAGTEGLMGGSGRAVRSTLPVLVVGRASSTTTVSGTRCAGRRSAQKTRRPGTSGTATRESDAVEVGAVPMGAFRVGAVGVGAPT